MRTSCTSAIRRAPSSPHESSARRATNSACRRLLDAAFGSHSGHSASDRPLAVDAVAGRQGKQLDEASRLTQPPRRLVHACLACGDTKAAEEIDAQIRSR